MTGDVQQQREALAEALRIELQGYAHHLVEQGCPSVREADVADLYAQLRIHGAPDLDNFAARCVKRVLDLGWRPVKETR